MDNREARQASDAEKMADFFDRRAGGYEKHMAEHIEEFSAFYGSVAKAIPSTIENPRVLDLGIGTGLELDALFERFPMARVTGIDVSQKMLQYLAVKLRPWTDRLQLTCGSFLDMDLGEQAHDVVVSVMALHHWIPRVKLGLYRRIRRALVPGGVFINADYVETEKESARRLAVYSAGAQGDRHLLHIDLPLTIDTEIELLQDAGFKSIQIPFRRAACATFLGTSPGSAPRE